MITVSLDSMRLQLEDIGIVFGILLLLFVSNSILTFTITIVL